MAGVKRFRLAQPLARKCPQADRENRLSSSFAAFRTLPMLSPDEAAFLTNWASCDNNHVAWVCDPATTRPSSVLKSSGNCWSPDEHERFLEAMCLFPTGPWKAIADHIGTRTARQARSHAQKHKEKLRRRHRKLERMQSYLTPRTDSPNASNGTSNTSSSSRRHGLPWTPAEQTRLDEALQLFPRGPWRTITCHVGTRTIRQVMAFAQKHRSGLSFPEPREVNGGYQPVNEPCPLTGCNGLEELIAEECYEDLILEECFEDLILQECFEEITVGDCSDSRSSCDAILNLLLFDDLDAEF